MCFLSMCLPKVIWAATIRLAFVITNEMITVRLKFITFLTWRRVSLMWRVSTMSHSRARGWFRRADSRRGIWLWGRKRRRKSEILQHQHPWNEICWYFDGIEQLSVFLFSFVLLIPWWSGSERACCSAAGWKWSWDELHTARSTSDKPGGLSSFPEKLFYRLMIKMITKVMPGWGHR